MELFLLSLLLSLILSNSIDCYQDGESTNNLHKLNEWWIIKIFVFLVPKIISLTPKNVTILAKNDAFFECKVVSFPAAQIYWMKDNRRLGNHNKKFDITSGPNVSYLRVKDASHSWSRHLLNISCIAENYLGKDQSYTFLRTLKCITTFYYTTWPFQTHNSFHLLNVGHYLCYHTQYKYQNGSEGVVIFNVNPFFNQYFYSQNNRQASKFPKCYYYESEISWTKYIFWNWM